MRLSLLLLLLTVAVLEWAVTTSDAFDVFTGSLRGRRYNRYRNIRNRNRDDSDDDEDDRHTHSRDDDDDRYDDDDDDDDDDDRYWGRSSRYRYGGSRREYNRNRYRRERIDRNRRRRAKNENIVRGLSGARAYGDSCITKPRYIRRRQSDRQLPVNVRDLRTVLKLCDRQLLHYAVDSNPARIRGAGGGGCVYRRPNIGLDHWGADPNAYLNTPFYTKQRRRSNRRYKVKKYRCGKRQLFYNQIHVAAEKEYCRRLRRYSTTPYCDACEYSAIIGRHEYLKSCTRKRLRSANSPALVHHYMNQCTREFGKKERRC